MASEAAMTIAVDYCEVVTNDYDGPDVVRAKALSQRTDCANAIDAAIQAAVLAEREACELEVLRLRDEEPYHSHQWWMIDSTAALIRQRSSNET